MTQREDTSGQTQVRSPEPETAAAGAPEVSPEEGAQAVAEGATEAVDPPAAGEPAVTPAPAVDRTAATPDRSDPKAAVEGVAEERPEVLVAGAFAGGLVLALVLKKVASD